jgi:hypothetical protein
VAARKAYLASIVDAVIVSQDKIRIIGSNDNIRSTFGPKANPRPWFVNLFTNGAQGRVVPHPSLLKQNQLLIATQDAAFVPSKCANVDREITVGPACSNGE